MNVIAKQAVCELNDVMATKDACSLFGLARSSYYHRHVAADQRRQRGGGAQPNALTADEQQAILDRLNSPRLRDKSPRQAHAELLDDGEYLASPRSFARILAKNNQSTDRQSQRQKLTRPKPQLLADDANRLWSWDTSPLATMVAGVFFHLYVILDVFSRFAVRWSVELAESAETAETLFCSACKIHDVDTTKLGVHGDNGPIQRAILIKDCFIEMGITKTHSRPYTSNDNAYSESLFKTAKYQPTYPWQFETLHDANAWADDCFTHYNYDYYHSGIGMLTPASVYFGTADEIIERRQETLDATYAVNPERFRNGKPVAKRPEPAWINKPADTTPEEADPSSMC